MPARFLLTTVLGLALLASSAAGQIVWRGDVDDLFGTNGNWVGGVAPPVAVNDSLRFGLEAPGGNYTVNASGHPHPERQQH